MRPPKVPESKFLNNTTPNSSSEEQDTPLTRVVWQLAVAAVGAGVVTTFAVAQGQDPLVALGITLFSACAAVVLGNWL